MKILITGIGCIGKSSLRERIANEFPDHVITVDMDYTRGKSLHKDKIVMFVPVHCFEEDQVIKAFIYNHFNMVI